MTTNNEHLVLRRRIAKRLGRAIGSTAWAIAVEGRYVSDALRPGDEIAEEDLANFLSNLLRVQDSPTSGRKGRRKPSEPPVSANLRARIEAVSRAAAEFAAEDEEILRFRQRVLGRDKPMDPDEAESYLDLPSARGRPTSDALIAGPTEVLEYQNATIHHSLHVWPGSSLDKLRKLALTLAESYPWQPAQAAAFVLEGLTPRATPFMLHLPQPLHEGRPRRARLVMEVDLWMPATQVLRAYRDAQRRVLPGHNRPISRRSVDLVNFVLRHRPATWPELLEAWNKEHPTAKYSDFRRLRFAFVRARGSLLFPRYRPYLGPGN